MDALRDMRGEEFLINIHGIDELNIKLNSGMIEAANTGFQVHLPVNQKDFAKKYNIAQAIAGPVLASAVNSALVFGKRLWTNPDFGPFTSLGYPGVKRKRDNPGTAIHRGNLGDRLGVPPRKFGGFFQEEIF